MAFCENCGTQLKDGTKFCPKCGNSVANQQSPIDSSTEDSSYSIALASYDTLKRLQLVTYLMEKKNVTKESATKIIDSAPCTIATGLSRSEAETISKEMQNQGALVYINNGDCFENATLIMVLSFFIPILGFLIFGLNWRKNPQKAGSAFLSGIWGIIVSSIISIIVYWDGYCRLAQILTGKF